MVFFIITKTQKALPQLASIHLQYNKVVFAASLRCRRHSPSLQAYICNTTRWSSQKKKEKRKEKTTPFGVNLLRSPVLYWAAQGGQGGLLSISDHSSNKSQLHSSCSLKLHCRQQEYMLLN